MKFLAKPIEEKKETKEEEKEKKKKKEPKDKDKKDKDDKKEDKKEAKKKKKADAEGENEEAGEGSPRTKRETGESSPKTKRGLLGAAVSELVLHQIEEQSREKVCFLHGQKLVYFCETCEEPICDKCILLGPHNNQVYPTSVLILITMFSYIASTA